MRITVLHDILTALGGAWRELIDLPVPRWLDADDGGENSPHLAAAMPFMGWLAGLVPMLAGMAAGWVFNRYAGVVLFTFSAWGMLYFKDSGKSGAALCRLLTCRAGNHEMSPVLPLIVEGFRFAMLAVLALQGGMALFPLILAGTFGIQAELATNRFNAAPLVPVEGRRSMWIVLIAVFVLGVLCCRLTAVVLGLTFALFQRICCDRMKPDGFTPEAITAAGYFAEWLLLGAAMLTA